MSRQSTHLVGGYPVALSFCVVISLKLTANADTINDNAPMHMQTTLILLCPSSSLMLQALVQTTTVISSSLLAVEEVHLATVALYV